MPPFLLGLDVKNRGLTILLLMSPLTLIVALVIFHLQAASLWADDALEGYNQKPAKAASARAQAITGFIISPAATIGGDASTGTITLREPAPAGGALVTLSSDGLGVVRAPKSVTVSEGRMSATFSISTDRVKAYTAVSFYATYGAETQRETVMLLPAARTEWYAASDANPKGKGSISSPWDLATALAGGPNRTEIKPGDILWLRGGLYKGAYTSTLSGREDAPIIVRAMPGERVVLDRAEVSESKQPALKVKGAHVWFWGMEIMNSNVNRQRKSPYEGRDEPWRGSGADVYAANVKFINMVFHDNGHGIWDKEDMTEIHGCLFFYNGNNKREHALYVGNTNGTKYITDNILFSQGGYGILAHSNSPSSSQKGLYIEGNVSFNNGLLTLDDQTTGNLQVGGVRGVAASRIVLKNNYIYNSPDNAASKNNGIRLGYEDRGNVDVKVLDNYVVSRDPVRLLWWQSVEFMGNTIYSQKKGIDLELAPGASVSAYRWDFNTYYSGQSGGLDFIRDLNSYSFQRWQQTSGLDMNSRALQSTALRPEGLRVFLRPNRYEAGRGHLIIYNWDLLEEVSVDLSSLLPEGASFEVRDAQNYFGEPIFTGKYSGRPILLPMKLKRVAQPIGQVERAPNHTSSEFAVFVILQTSRPDNKAPVK